MEQTVMDGNIREYRTNFRLYPDDEQKMMLAKIFGCARLVYNKAYEWFLKDYAMYRLTKSSGTMPEGYVKYSFAGMCRKVTELKKTDEYAFLKEVDSTALQQKLKDFDTAVSRFFKGEANFPKPKSKINRQTYRTVNPSVKIGDGGKYIYLPKVGHVRIKKTRDIGKIHSVTVIKERSGRYYISILHEALVKVLPEPVNDVVGMDAGIRNTCTFDDGSKVESPKYLKRLLKRLRRMQRQLSRKQKGSKNRNKQRLVVARLYEKVTSQRTDFLHKLSTCIVRDNQTICIETLRIIDMVLKKSVEPCRRKRNAVNRCLYDAALGEFLKMLEYKADWYNRMLIKAPADYKSSQTCHICGNINEVVSDIRIRQWDCPRCGTHHDRDVNAAINIKNICTEMMAG